MADFATVAEFNTRTGMGVDSARGAAILADVSAEIRLYTDQDIEETAGRQEEFAADPFKGFIELSQVPVTAVTSVTVDGVVFTDYEWDRWNGSIRKNDLTPWDEGPILVTYDSGYAAASDEMAGLKSLCIEVAARALGGIPQDTFGTEIPELRGAPHSIFFTEQEQRRLDKFQRLVMA